MKTKNPPTKMMTVEEFISLPFSDAIEQVLFDIENNLPKNVNLMMGYWATINNNSQEICSVCLGGAALMSFYTDVSPECFSSTFAKRLQALSPRYWADILEFASPDRPVAGVYKQQGLSFAYESISYAMDHLRSGHLYSALLQWYEALGCCQLITAPARKHKALQMGRIWGDWEGKSNSQLKLSQTLTRKLSKSKRAPSQGRAITTLNNLGDYFHSSWYNNSYTAMSINNADQRYLAFKKDMNAIVEWLRTQGL